MAKRDYYEILGVVENAAADVLKKAYHKLALEVHPDRNPDDPVAEDRFKEISEAYAILSDPEKRRQYDLYGHGDFSLSLKDMADIFEHFEKKSNSLDEDIEKKSNSLDEDIEKTSKIVGRAMIMVGVTSLAMLAMVFYTSKSLNDLGNGLEKIIDDLESIESTIDSIEKDFDGVVGTEKHTGNPRNNPHLEDKYPEDRGWQKTK